MQDIDIRSSRKEVFGESPTSECACGGHNEELPELDAQTIPHALRHAAVFGAIESLRPGFALVISATHDPVPLLNQLRDRHADAFTARYLETGPERWRLLIRNVSA